MEGEPYDYIYENYASKIIEDYENYLRDRRTEYDDGEIDFELSMEGEVDSYVYDLSEQDMKDIIDAYGFGNAFIKYYNDIDPSIYEEEDDGGMQVESKLVYFILYDSIMERYDKIKKSIYEIWNE